jgi:hypothetical protein
MRPAVIKSDQVLTCSLSFFVVDGCLSGAENGKKCRPWHPDRDIVPVGHTAALLRSFLRSPARARAAQPKPDLNRERVGETRRASALHKTRERSA